MFRPVDLGRLRAQPQLSARDSFPLVTCGFLQRRTKGRPSGRLHSNAQVSQQETPKTMHTRSEHRVWYSEGGKKNCVLCIFSPSGKQPFSSPLCVASRLEQATRVYSGEICQKFEPHSQHSRCYLNYPSI